MSQRYYPTGNSEAETLAWYLRNSTEPPSYEDILAYAQAKRARILPGSREQHEAYLNEHRGQPNAKLIRHYRCKAVFGVWPDGRNRAPDLSNVPLDRQAFVKSQCSPTLYLKWLGVQDPVAHAKYIEERLRLKAAAKLAAV